MDLKKYMDSLPSEKMLEQKLVRSYNYQITAAILLCHRRRVLHCDLKPRNLLINNDGLIKVADFGSGIEIPICNYTHEVLTTLWYRAPEVLLRTRRYSCSVDVWSLGCIFAEMLTRKPLFQGDSEIDQLFRMFRILKTPTEDIWHGVTQMPDYKPSFPCWTQYNLKQQVKNMDSAAFDLLQKTLVYDPALRISAKEMLEHKYFESLDTSLVNTIPLY